MSVHDFSNEHIGKFVVRGGDVRVNHPGRPPYPVCHTCSERATHIEVCREPRTIITRIGRVFEQTAERHWYYCAEHTGVVS